MTQLQSILQDDSKDICDTQYCFSFKNENKNDSRILKNSKTRKMFDNKTNTPESEVIPEDNLELTFLLYSETRYSL